MLGSLQPTTQPGSCRRWGPGLKYTPLWRSGQGPPPPPGLLPKQQGADGPAFSGLSPAVLFSTDLLLILTADTQTGVGGGGRGVREFGGREEGREGLFACPTHGVASNVPGLLSLTNDTCAVKLWAVPGPRWSVETP